LENLLVNGLYNVVIRYFLLMLILLLVTGVWLLLLHSGVTVDSLLHYYAQKTLFGVLETLTPHFLFMSLMMFILTHFLALKNVYTKMDKVLSYLLLIFMFLSLITPLFINENFWWIIYIKIFSMALFLVLSCWIGFRVVKHLRVFASYNF